MAKPIEKEIDVLIRKSRIHIFIQMTKLTNYIKINKKKPRIKGREIDFWNYERAFKLTDL